MEYAKFGKTAISVSRVMLGTWAIGGENWGPYDEGEAVRAVETAIELGINAIDTAPAYGSGRAEKLIGKVLKGRRENVFVATKCGLDIENGMRIDLSPAAVQKELAASLKRLGTDYIDLYQCHWPDPSVPIADTMGALVRFRKEGKIRFIGVSNFSGTQIEEALKYAEIATLQPQYSLLDREIESEIQPLCAQRGIAILAYAPLGGGLLTGKYAERPRFTKSDARSFFYKYYQEGYWPRVKAVVDTVKQIASEKGAKPSHVAIAWVLARSGVLAALVGARNASQALENVDGASLALDPAEIEELDRVSAKLYE
jgi:aryl-alcohol dehydrogenase-like predicted oxidoreductase